jgi:hypothetical protein
MSVCKLSAQGDRLSGVEESIEVRYAGVVVGRTMAARGLDAAGGFVGIPEPLPVGTIVTLKFVDGTREARVAEVVESSDPNIAGMRVSFDLGARPAASPAARPIAPAATAAAPAPAEQAPVEAFAPAEQAPVEAAPASSSDPGAAPVAEGPDDASAPLPAPLSLAGPSPGQQNAGGGKKRRKRR